MILPVLCFIDDDIKLTTDHSIALNETNNTFFADALFNTPLNEIDARWETFQNDLNTRSVDKYLEIYQKVYDEKMK